MNLHPIVSALVARRRQLGWTQEALGRRLYKTAQAIAQFENSPGGRQLLLVEEVAASLGLRLVLVPAEEEQ